MTDITDLRKQVKDSGAENSELVQTLLKQYRRLITKLTLENAKLKKENKRLKKK